MKRDYFEGVDVAVTICAKDGTILDMNQKSKKTSPTESANQRKP